MRLFSVVFLSFGLALSQAKPHVKRWDDFVEKHSLIDLKLGLKSARIDELATHLMQTSDPAHPRYGQHLSKEEVEALVAPHADSTAAVEEWLEFYSAKGETSTSGEWITIRLPVADAERMLNAKYGLYHHDKSKDTVLRTLSYSLPRELMAHVDVPELDVAIEKGTINFGADIEPGSDATVPASCGTTITPSCLKGLYNTTNYTPRAASQNSLGVAGYLDEFANHADLRTFLARFLPSASDQAGSDFTTIRVNNGGDDQNDPGVEANLDIQYTIAMSFPTPNTYYSTGGSPPFNPDSQTPTNTNEPYLDWLNFILDQTSIPLVFTTSYGDDEQTVPQDYANKVCDLFMRLGARGSSVLFSSGDFGVGGGDCATNDGTNRRLFQPAFPASCPWVTAVGGTTRVNPEVAVNFSGGGFSRYFAQPSYQSTAVNSFLSVIGTTNQGLFNATGRAYPDVAAQGTGFQVVIGGRTGSVGGTSASCPTVAGIIALLNDFRLSNGKSSLGFLNPLIYANPTAFNDITSGNNPGCGTNGFSARAGWDPVTGFGTPDFVKLQALV